MSHAYMRFRPVRFLLLLVLLFVGGLAWLWFDQNAQLRHVTWVAPKALPPDISVPVGPTRVDAAANDPSRFAAVLERPIFAPDRRPPPPPPAPTPPPPPDPLANIHLHGIFSGENAGIIARVEDKMRRVKINETIGSWTLKSIDDRDVTFTQGTTSRKLHLSYARLNAVSPKAAASSARPASAPVPAPESGAGGISKNSQDETRDRLRRLNESRASRGLPPINR
ncbi:hypothetical protein [Rhodoferax sp.]|uniref:hypothetical protein n=1 Tax=Rhodoferax sp. TaxID=50421 RepID=UPI002628999B|nr:hypothetical protein [Rhodoferax sp.]MDD2919851.1 hypothetical protein [Rhodoferax sp.]